ncbi:hypothetical protein V7S43_016659 [Phytophthora oleae]|uniref:Uncharacterized protein n=1 Tax=Phytophthora oleae TaxID=2107226 RepID=A0ABD3EYX9_9STRA
MEDFDMVEEKAEFPDAMSGNQVSFRDPSQDFRRPVPESRSEYFRLGRRGLVSESKLRYRVVTSELETLKTKFQNSENQRLEPEFADRWQQREAEAERARMEDEMKRDWISQMEDLQQRVQDVEAEREREKESSQSVQRFSRPVN